MKNSWKKTAAFVLAFTLVAAPLTQTAGKGGLFGGSAITAKAAPPNNTDSGALIGNVTVGKTETLLTTLTFGGSSTYSETTSGVVSVTATNVRDYDSKYGWLWFDELSVTAKEGYTITKCVFIQNSKNPITDTEAPFEIHFDSDMWYIKEDTRGDMDGVTSIEVYGYASSAATAVTGVELNKTSTELTVGGNETLTATVSPDGATDKTVKWSVGGTDASAVKLYTDEACTTEVGADATETLTVYAKGISAGSATVTATSNADSEKKASCDVTVNAAQTQTEELLTTITATGKEQASFSKENVANVSFSYSAGGSSAYLANWGWWGYGWTATVTPSEGY
uniref:Ig-like domain-containing protein n=1 Tax=uncultured Ruminococcus sp. TaxID=165186 RepID=UPI0025CB8FB5